MNANETWAGYGPEPTIEVARACDRAARRSEPDGCGAVDQTAFENAIRENLAPEGVAMVIAYLRPALSERPTTEDGRNAQQQVRWLADTLFEMLGTAEYNRLLEEIGL